MSLSSEKTPVFLKVLLFHKLGLLVPLRAVGEKCASAAGRPGSDAPDAAVVAIAPFVGGATVYKL
jgi:hypothetical protein